VHSLGGSPLSLIRGALSFLRWEPGSGDKSALFLPGGPRGVLCLHGFTGTPFEVRPLAEALAGQGFTVAAPALAGHCGTVDELACTTWPDWLASAEQALLRLSDDRGGARVAVAGFSLGGLLALRLARLHPGRIAALAVMAAPLRLHRYQAVAVQVVTRLPALLRRGPLAALPKFRGFDVHDPEMSRRNPGLPALPVSGIASLIELGALVRRDLPDVTTPTLIIHGERDRTVPVQDSLELAGTIGSTVVERLFLPRSGHLVAIDVERTILGEAVSRFFTTQMAGARTVAGRSSSS
jgi:carboxylesterase